VVTIQGTVLTLRSRISAPSEALDTIATHGLAELHIVVKQG